MCLSVLGKDLKVGDVIEVWWGRDRIVGMVPYTGPLSCLQGSMIASFALNNTGMTIEPNMIFTIL